MASSFRLPSGLKVKSDVVEYDECMKNDEIEGISGQETQRQWSDRQKKQQDLFKKIPVADLLVIARDRGKLARWIEAHAKHEKIALRVILEELDLGVRGRDALKSGNDSLTSSLGLIDSRSAAPIEAEDVDLAVAYIHKLMNTMPLVAAIVLEEVVPDVRESMVRQCDEIRDAIQGIRAYVRAEAIKDCRDRMLSPHNLNILVELILRRDAPQAALRESEELASLRSELSTVNEEIAHYMGEHDKQKTANDEVRAELEQEKESRQTAETELESVKTVEQQAQRDLAAARQELQLRKGQLLEKEGVETALEESEAKLKAESETRDRLETELADSKSKSGIEREAAAKQLENAKANLLEQFKEQLANADRDAKAGLSKLGDEAKESIADARRAQDVAEANARVEKEKREKAERDLSGVRTLLGQEKERFELKSNALAAAKEDLNKQKIQAIHAAAQLETANTALLNEKAARVKAEGDLKAEREALEKLKAQLRKSEKVSERHEQVVKAHDAAQKALREERSVLATVRESLANFKLDVHELNEQHKAELQTEHNFFTVEQRAHEATKQELNETETRLIRKVQVAQERSNQLQNALDSTRVHDEADKKRLERDLGSQSQAVDAFLEYSTASLAQGSGSASLVIAPRAQELTTMHVNHKEVALDQSEQLPMIVVASGQLPAAFSYLGLASGGVLTGSRFNRAVTSLNLLWVLDTLDRVVKAVVASQEPVPEIVLIVLLQGIAYVHLATRFTSVTTTPRLKDMLSFLYKLIPRTPQRSVLATVYRLLSRLLYFQSSIDSWILDDSPLDKRLDSSNSALPEGITLIHSAGYLFLQESATDGKRLFVFEPEAVQFVTPRVGHTDMILPLVNGFNLRRLEIARRLEHAPTSSWLRENGLMARLL